MLTAYKLNYDINFLTVLEENTAEIEKKVGVPIHVSKILVRDMKKAKELYFNALFHNIPSKVKSASTDIT